MLGTSEGKEVFWSKEKEKAVHSIQFSKARIEDVVVVESPFAVRKSDMIQIYAIASNFDSLQFAKISSCSTVKVKLDEDLISENFMLEDARDSNSNSNDKYQYD
jgi:hypothetical protein